MLSKKHRISKKAFKTIGNQGPLTHTPLFSLRVGANKEAVAKASFVVSGKVSSGAIMRNRLRRVGYEALRAILPKLKPQNYIFFLKKEASLVKSSELAALINETLKKHTT